MRILNKITKTPFLKNRSRSKRYKLIEMIRVFGSRQIVPTKEKGRIKVADKM